MVCWIFNPYVHDLDICSESCSSSLSSSESDGLFTNDEGRDGRYTVFRFYIPLIFQLFIVDTAKPVPFMHRWRWAQWLFPWGGSSVWYPWYHPLVGGRQARPGRHPADRAPGQGPQLWQDTQRQLWTHVRVLQAQLQGQAQDAGQGNHNVIIIHRAS